MVRAIPPCSGGRTKRELVGPVSHPFLYEKHRNNAKLVGMNGLTRQSKRRNGQRYVLAKRMGGWSRV